jgi:hypothetical protein
MMNIAEATKEAATTDRAMARTGGMFAGIVKIRQTNNENFLIRGAAKMKSLAEDGNSRWRIF